MKNDVQNVHQKSDLDIIIDLIKLDEKITLKDRKSVKTVQRIIKEYGEIIYIGASKTGHLEIKE